MPNSFIHGAYIVFLIILSLVLPAVLTLSTVISPVEVILTSDNPTPYGYTISLSLFVFPMLVLGWWFFRKAQLKSLRKAVLLAAAVLVPTGIVLDLLFGNSFFVFENHNAVVGITIPAVGGDIPIEEIVFYISGFLTVLLIYVWCDEYWFKLYNVPDYAPGARKLKRILQFHPGSIIIGIFLVLLAILYRKNFAESSDGFPWYFIYITAVALVPSMALFKSAQHFINWRAFSFTCFIIVLISLIWEVTLALPYQWWGFQDRAMIGLYVGAWFNLPIEEFFVWFGVSYATVIIYEAIKIWLASGRKFRHAFFGINSTN